MTVRAHMCGGRRSVSAPYGCCLPRNLNPAPNPSPNPTLDSTQPKTQPNPTQPNPTKPNPKPANPRNPKGTSPPKARRACRRWTPTPTPPSCRWPSLPPTPSRPSCCTTRRRSRCGPQPAAWGSTREAPSRAVREGGRSPGIHPRRGRGEGASPAGWRRPRPNGPARRRGGALRARRKGKRARNRGGRVAPTARHPSLALPQILGLTNYSQWGGAEGLRRCVARDEGLRRVRRRGAGGGVWGGLGRTGPRLLAPPRARAASLQTRRTAPDGAAKLTRRGRLGWSRAASRTGAPLSMRGLSLEPPAPEPPGQNHHPQNRPRQKKQTARS